jgi:hypothetical protein
MDVLSLDVAHLDTRILGRVVDYFLLPLDRVKTTN